MITQGGAYKWFVKAKYVADKSDAPKPVGCVIVKDDRIIAYANNSHHGNVCPRFGMPTGKGYDLCDFCSYENHAEAKAVKNTDLESEEMKGATAYIYGHSYACEPCQEALAFAGIKDIRISEIL